MIDPRCSTVLYLAVAMLSGGGVLLMTAACLVVHNMRLAERQVGRLQIECERLKQYAFVDDVTGLYPRRYGMAQLREALRAEVRGGLVFIDLDDFGRINKRFDWQVGDAVLRNAGELVRTVARRRSDVALKYGGDELLVFIEGDEKTFHAMALCLQVRFRCAMRPLPDGQRPTGTTGVAYVRPDEPGGWNLDGLIKRAQDDALARKEQRTK